MDLYIKATDFVTIFVGPFASESHAQIHVDKVCGPRGDSAKIEFCRPTEGELGRADWVMTEEEDREFDVSFAEAQFPM